MPDGPRDIAPLRTDRLAISLVDQQMRSPRRRRGTLGEWFAVALLAVMIYLALSVLIVFP